MRSTTPGRSPRWQSQGEIDTVRFLWSQGGAGTMTRHREGDLLAELTVVFDQG
jgi:hypothetical protein